MIYSWVYQLLFREKIREQQDQEDEDREDICRRDEEWLMAHIQQEAILVIQNTNYNT